MTGVRTAIIGAGHLGRIHTRLIGATEHLDLVGVVDPLPAARDQVADEFGVPTFEHHQDLAGKIDAAIIATTTDSHHSVATDLLQSGVHLFVEKPLALSVTQATEMVELADHASCILQVGHVERFNPAWKAVAPYSRRPRYIEAVRTSGHTFRSTDIGAVLDLMIHDLDLVLSLAKSEVVEVDGIGSTIFGPHEDMAHAHLRFANGCIANLNTSRTSFQSQRTMQIVTDRTYVGVDFAAPSAKIVRPSKQVLRGEIEVQGLSFEEREHLRHTLFTDLLPVRDIPLAATNAIQEEQRDFGQAILRGKSPLVCGHQALKCLSVAEKILEQIASSDSRSLRSTVPVPDLTQSRRKAG